MSTTSGMFQSEPRPGVRAEAALEAEHHDWIIFAGIMLMILGIINVIYGIAAIDRANFYIADANYVISDLRTWGWVALALGALQCLAAFSIWGGGTFGRWFGVACASANAVAQLLAIPGYPFLAVTLLGLDILVIYALVAHGGGRARA
jgi:hypothetical protein